MAKDVKVTLDSANVKKILRGQGVRADIEARLNRIAAAAGPGHVVAMQLTEERWRGVVIAASYAAKKAEASDRTLSNAIDAGR